VKRGIRTIGVTCALLIPAAASVWHPCANPKVEVLSTQVGSLALHGPKGASIAQASDITSSFDDEDPQNDLCDDGDPSDSM